jgi:hypothetical protein
MRITPDAATVYPAVVLAAILGETKEMAAHALAFAGECAAMACAALVLGYEGPDLRKRFGEREGSAWLPRRQSGTSALIERIRIYPVILLPWLVIDEGIGEIEKPLQGTSTYLPFEKNLPVLEQAEPIYASNYLAAILAPFLIPSRAALRRFARTPSATSSQSRVIQSCARSPDRGTRLLVVAASEVVHDTNGESMRIQVAILVWDNILPELVFIVPAHPDAAEHAQFQPESRSLHGHNGALRVRTWVPVKVANIDDILDIRVYVPEMAKGVDRSCADGGLPVIGRQIRISVEGDIAPLGFNTDSAQK